ncbi:MAG: P-type Cu+ transporter [Actinomycetota bacterium]|nr:P-type Cu+ transporter [Actinomycetota bacterium]
MSDSTCTVTALVLFAGCLDTLISLGTLAAFGWSLYALLFGTAGTPGMRHPFEFTIERMSGDGAIYLEVAAGVTTFIPGRALLRTSRRRPKRSGGCARSA